MVENAILDDGFHLSSALVNHSLVTTVHPTSLEVLSGLEDTDITLHSSHGCPSTFSRKPEISQSSQNIRQEETLTMFLQQQSSLYGLGRYDY